MARINKDMVIGDILKKDIGGGIAQILRNAGMHCVGCPSAASETLEQAANAHNMDAEVLLEEINLFLQQA